MTQMKLRKAAVCGSVFLFSVFFLIKPCFAEPLSVDIKANDQDGPVLVELGDPVSVTIGVVAGDKVGETADWWVAVGTPFDPPESMYTYIYPTGWTTEIQRFIQVGLLDVGSFRVMDNMVLPEGSYTFYFGVNDPIRSLFPPWWGLDSVEVTVWDMPPSFTNSLGQTFNLLPTWTFTMGSPDGPETGDDEHPQHEVTITQFYMQTTEVTQAQWEAVMGSNPSAFSGCPTCPVEQVTWNDIQEFLAKMNTRGEGTYSLPTEAQWEYAARAGSTTAFYNGGVTELYCEYDPNLDAIGWYCYNSGWETHPVAQKVPNAWGLYDMLGNVYEWCQDWYSNSYYSDSPSVDPLGPATGSQHVVRGGHWDTGAVYCRSALRHRYSPYVRRGFLGFRLVVSLSPLVSSPGEQGRQGERKASHRSKME